MIHMLGKVLTRGFISRKDGQADVKRKQVLEIKRMTTNQQAEQHFTKLVS